MSSVTPILLFHSYQYLPTSLATTIHFMYPTIVMLLCLVFFHDRFSKSKLLCLLLCFVGIITLNASHQKVIGLGFLLALCSGLTWALYIVLMDKYDFSGMTSEQIVYMVAIGDLLLISNRDIELFSDDLQLCDRSRAVHVACDEQRPLALLLAQQTCKLCNIRRLTGALQTDHHDDGGRMGSIRQLRVCAAHESRQLFVDDLDDLLCRCQAFHYLCADRTGRHRGHEVLDDLIAHIRFQKRKAHLPHRKLDVFLTQAALIREFLWSILLFPLPAIP